MVEKNIKTSSVMIRATPLMETLTGIMIAGFIAFSGQLIAAGELEVNNFFSFLAAMMLAYQPVRSLATVNIAIQQGLSGAKRVLPIIDETPQIQDKKDAKNLEFKKGEIIFENVDFNYSNEGIILKSVNLNFPGEKIVIGCGHGGFHKECILDWMNITNSCPVCRTPITTAMRLFFQI